MSIGAKDYSNPPQWKIEIEMIDERERGLRYVLVTKPSLIPALEQAATVLGQIETALVLHPVHTIVTSLKVMRAVVPCEPYLSKDLNVNIARLLERFKD